MKKENVIHALCSHFYTKNIYIFLFSLFWNINSMLNLIDNQRIVYKQATQNQPDGQNKILILKL